MTLEQAARLKRVMLLDTLVICSLVHPDHDTPTNRLLIDKLTEQLCAVNKELDQLQLAIKQVEAQGSYRKRIEANEVVASVLVQLG